MMFDVRKIPNDTNYLNPTYNWRVGFNPWHLSAAKHDDIMDWIHTTDTKCAVASSAIFFRTKEDVTLFLLRWS